MSEMVCGDENLRFTDAEIGEGFPARRPFRRRPAAPQEDPEDLLATLQATILIGLLIVGPLAIGLAEYAKRPAHQQPAQRVHLDQRLSAPDIQAASRRSSHQSARATGQPRPASNVRATGPVAGVHVWYLKGLDGQTYAIESRPGELPYSVPPGFRAAYCFAGTPIHDAPDGNVVAWLTKTTPVLHAIPVSREPCWRRIATADGAVTGYSCIVMPPWHSRPTTNDPSSLGERATDRAVTDDAFAPAHRPSSRGFLPSAFACADVPGRFRMITSGPVEQQGLYELPLCDELGVAKRAYTISEGTQMPRLLHKVAPEYSEAARLARREGTVVLDVLIDEQGTPAAFRIIRSLGLGLDENAVKAVRRWSCRPAYRGETPVPMWVRVEVNFRVL